MGGLIRVTSERANAYEPMVIERNLQWMTVLPQLLDGGGSIIDVGAMHLPGPQGLVALLRASGYQVEPITLHALP